MSSGRRHAFSCCSSSSLMPCVIGVCPNSKRGTVSMPGHCSLSSATSACSRARSRSTNHWVPGSGNDRPSATKLRPRGLSESTPASSGITPNKARVRVPAAMIPHAVASMVVTRVKSRTQKRVPGAVDASRWANWSAVPKKRAPCGLNTATFNRCSRSQLACSGAHTRRDPPWVLASAPKLVAAESSMASNTMARTAPIIKASGTLPQNIAAATTIAMPGVHSALLSRLCADQAVLTRRTADWFTIPPPAIINTAASTATGSQVSHCPATSTKTNITTADPAATLRGLPFICAAATD